MNTETVLQSIASNKEIQKNLSKMNYPLTNEELLNHIQDYIKAVKEGRMLCIIPKVSASGMSRQIKFHSFEPNTSGNGGYYRQYYALFQALGYKAVKGNRDAFTISGCGMDMIFHTNYTNMHDFKSLGIITAEECSTLAQKTPTVL